MVSDQFQGLTPYELFQELKSLKASEARLNEQLRTIRELKSRIGHLLTAEVRGANSPVNQVGIVAIDGANYLYELDMETGEIEDFYELTTITPENGGISNVQQST